MKIFKFSLEFSLNERILMMSIAHLDMVLTLRQLNVLMPDPEVIEIFKKPQVVRTLEKPKYCSPYLEPNPRPSLEQDQKRKPYKKAIEKFDLHPYNDWNDPRYIPKNTKNRWFVFKSRNQKVSTIIAYL